MPTATINHSPGTLLGESPKTPYLPPTDASFGVEYDEDTRPILTNAVSHIQSDDVIKIIAKLIEVYPYKFRWLKGRQWVALWQRQGGKDRGIPRLSGFTILKGLAHALTKTLSPDYVAIDVVFWLAADNIGDRFTTHYALEAIIFKLLCSINEDEKGKLSAVASDFDGFFDELNIYGTWTFGLQRAQDRFSQLSFDDEMAGTRFSTEARD